MQVALRTNPSGAARNLHTKSLQYPGNFASRSAKVVTDPSGRRHDLLAGVNVAVPLRHVRTIVESVLEIFPTIGNSSKNPLRPEASIATRCSATQQLATRNAITRSLNATESNNESRKLMSMYNSIAQIGDRNFSGTAQEINNERNRRK